jgi:hypothetical protein
MESNETARWSQQRSLPALLSLLAIPHMPALVWTMDRFNNLVGRVPGAEMTPAEQEAAWATWVAALGACSHPDLEETSLGTRQRTRYLGATRSSYGPYHTEVVICARIDLPEESR